VAQPRDAGDEIAFHRGGRDADNRGNLVDLQSAEISHLENLRLPRVDRRKLRERGVEGQDVDVHAAVRILDVRERHRSTREALALGRLFLAGVIDQNATHHLRRDPEEMRAVFPVDTALRDQPKVRLVHDVGRLERVARALLAQVRRRELPEFAVHDHHQLLFGFR
jgi:hypothetical protein